MKYTITTTATLIIATAESGTERLIFPYYWNGWKRTYTGASISGAAPQHERFVDEEWQREVMDILLWMQWMSVLETLPANADRTVLEVEFS